MSAAANSGLLAPSDIAELAGVTRAAVSNWRKRRPDFPDPSGGSIAKPLFKRADIEGWLVANGYELQLDAGELTVWALVNRFRADVPNQLARPLVQAVLCARKLADGTPDMDELKNAAHHEQFLEALHHIARRPTSDPRWIELVTGSFESVLELTGVPARFRPAIEQFGDELFLTVSEVGVDKLADISDHVLTRFGAAEGRMAGEHGVVGSRISHLLAQVASGARGIAYDPACGVGEALLRLWQESPRSNRMQLVGNDINAEAVLVSKQRCFLYGADATIDRANVLDRDPVPTLLADVVVAEPPFGMAMPPGFSLTDTRWSLGGPPPKNNSESAWLQHAVAHLAPEGWAYVVTGLGPTTSTTTAQIRRALVRARCIDAIVALPPKMLLHTAIPTVLWVLRSPHTSTPADHVTFFDMSQMDPSENLPVQAWLSKSKKHDELTAARATVEDVLADDQVNLNPRRWIQLVVDDQEVVERYQRAATALARTIEFLRQDHHKLRMATPAASSQTVNMAALEKQGAVQIMQPRTKARRDEDTKDADESPWVVTTRMVREGLPELPEAGPDFSSVTTDSPFDIPTVDYSVTEPGDVLVTTMRTVRAVVDETGGRTLRPGVIRIRVNRRQLDPHYVAECLAGSWNQRIETGAYIPHANIRDLEVPLLPIEEQVDVVSSLSRIRSLASAGRALESASDDLAQAQLESLRFDVRLEDH